MRADARLVTHFRMKEHHAYPNSICNRADKASTISENMEEVTCGNCKWILKKKGMLEDSNEH